MFQSVSEYLHTWRPKILHVPSVESHIQKLLQKEGLKHSLNHGKGDRRRLMLTQWGYKERR